MILEPFRLVIKIVSSTFTLIAAGVWIAKGPWWVAAPLVVLGVIYLLDLVVYANEGHR